MNAPIVLTIAGFDGSGGAGVDIDMRTIRLNGCFAHGAITALTAQNSTRVDRVVPVNIDMLEAQLHVLADEVDFSAIKIGLIPNLRCVEAIVSFVAKYDIHCPIVVDPVSVSTSGTSLAESGVAEVLIERLGSKLTVLMPNVQETEELTGKRIGILNEVLIAGEQIRHKGCENVIVTGGHILGHEGTDVWFFSGGFEILAPQERFTDSVRGTGCMFSSALAANLAQRVSMRDAIVSAKSFVEAAIRNSVILGNGQPVTSLGVSGKSIPQ
ncbi:MAG: bifunctional hydroxymethylpyrimidine kinase/phosphomethylpyrimidine kinase [Gammaproteobacteria bacterium]|nr:bifunctional hydroxymethylpyrimidine kinase/phosphomethylpyrimidine kinase [Gammaproteobacteria bacterium]